MADDQPTPSLPTELIDDKTFYTLGGASAGVLLVCWAINYVAVDASWVNYKTFRFIGILLSEAFAVIIVLKAKKKSSMKWLFAFLNGILIFINASGLNTMTSSYIFNPKDSTAKKSGYFRNQHTASYQQAGIICLPRMVSWWPDEKLVKQNEQLVEQTHSLDSANNQLKTLLQSSENEKTNLFLHQKDSLLLVISSLQTQLTDKQSQIDQLTASAQGSTNELQRQLTECLNSNGDLKGKISAYARDLAQCNNDKNSLTGRVNELTQQLANASGQTTLTELLKQVCEKQNTSILSRLSRVKGTQTPDDILRQQNFYKNINWNAFCQAFNGWYYPIK